MVGSFYIQMILKNKFTPVSKKINEMLEERKMRTEGPNY